MRKVGKKRAILKELACFMFYVIIIFLTAGTEVSYGCITELISAR